ncbi:MAG: hypothetical protein RR350_02140, partial [Oscillibacter sp.]
KTRLQSLWLVSHSAGRGGVTVLRAASINQTAAFRRKNGTEKARRRTNPPDPGNPHPTKAGCGFFAGKEWDRAKICRETAAKKLTYLSAARVCAILLLL